MGGPWSGVEGSGSRQVHGIGDRSQDTRIQVRVCAKEDLRVVSE